MASVRLTQSLQIGQAVLFPQTVLHTRYRFGLICTFWMQLVIFLETFCVECNCEGKNSNFWVVV